MTINPDVDGDKVGARRQADQALVSDGAQLHSLHPSGFDPSRVEWLTLHRAPRDGSIILASGLDWGDGPRRHLAFVRWEDCAWLDANDPGMEMRYLTHWLDTRSLPEPGAASGIEDSAQDAEERLDPKGESPTPKGDAQP